MIDLFNLLQNLVREEFKVIAAFLMGGIVSLVFLSYAVYRLIGSHHARKVDEMASDLTKLRASHKDAERALADAKKKAKERKEKLEDRDAEVARLEAAVRQADEWRQREKETAQALLDLKVYLGVRDAKYTELVHKYNKLGGVATYWKKQAASLAEQAKLVEKMQGHLWDVRVDKSKIVPFRPLGPKCAVIIALINLKGGVGKTTLTANLAATYARQRGQRVLLVDLDFQQSLTNLCLPADEVGRLEAGYGKLVDNVFDDLAADSAALAFGNHVPTPEPRLHLLASSENLANVEERSKARWLMNPNGADIRCVLRSALHAPLFQENFDLILIDCPPRWTTTSINAIACCDYVLIPTQLDRVSSEAVPRLLKWLRNLRSSSAELYGNFQVLGVLGNLSYPRAKLIEQEQMIWKALPEKCQDRWGAPVHHYDTIIKDKSEFRRAANRREFAALSPELQPIFLKLVEEIEARRCIHEGR